MHDPDPAATAGCRLLLQLDTRADGRQAHLMRVVS